MGDMGEAMTEFLTERASITGVWKDYRTYMHQDFINWLCGHHPHKFQDGGVNDEEEWVWLERGMLLANVYYCPKDEEEYLGHWGKWLVFASPEALWNLARKLEKYINRGEIDSVKFNRKPSPIGYGDCVMCVYCDDRDKERVWGIIHSVGVSSPNIER